MTNIPGDQRSIIALAKVGGLVGKVTEIDEKARYRWTMLDLRLLVGMFLKFPRQLRVP